jgi:hypothetical protein
MKAHKGLGNKKSSFFKLLLSSEPAGTRTQDPYIKSVMLYQLSYEFNLIFRWKFFNSLFYLKEKATISDSLLCFCDPAGTRTQDPNIKSVVLYQLSYEIYLIKVKLF